MVIKKSTDDQLMYLVYSSNQAAPSFTLVTALSLSSELNLLPLNSMLIIQKTSATIPSSGSKS